MSDVIDIDTLKKHLAVISNARKDIILSTDTTDEKQLKLNLFDKENDELNQSIDIFFRLMEYTVTTDIQKINELLLSLENGTVDIISRFAPALYRDMAQHFSSNTGLSSTVLSSISAYSVSNFSEIYSYLSNTFFGSYLVFSVLNDLLCGSSFFVHSSFRLNLSTHNITFNSLSFIFRFSSPFAIFVGGFFHKSNSVTYAILNTHISNALSFYNCSIFLSDFTYILNSTSFLNIELNNVIFLKDSNYLGGTFISTSGHTVNLIAKDVSLLDSLTWDDIVDDINNINFI